ncbi:MAG: MYXO-CTERM sorting domain-containing protein [bacterium]
MRAITALLTLALLTATAHARPEYPTWVPTPYDCETCHLDPNDRLNRTGFGIDFALQRGNWVDPARPGQGLCYLDSDFDGLSNGVELADPACTWRRGDRLPAGPTTHPGDERDPDRCGDGMVQPWEACDGALIETDCLALGFAGGELRCFSNCTLDARRCERRPPPDRGVPEPDAAVDAMVAEPDGGIADAMPDAIDGAIVDAALDAMVADPPDATADDMTAPDITPADAEPAADTAPLDADAAADAGPADPMPPLVTEPGDGCRAAPAAPTAPGGWLLALAALVIHRRRRDR